MTPIFIDQLIEQLKKPLLGESAQFKMAPPTRKRISQITLDLYQPKISAVLILFYYFESSWQIVFIERPKYDGVHSGQFAFPGGKFEDKDIDLEQTALRETEEEIGLTSQSIAIIGKLSNVYISPSNFLVTPFVGYVNQPIKFIADKREVAKIHLIKVKDFLIPEVIKFKSITLANGVLVKAPCYCINQITIWGATAMMMAELTETVKDLIINRMPK